MSDAHSVLAHLGVRAAEYDATIPRFVPGYGAMIAAVVRWLDGHVAADGTIVDLGAGTGALSAAILAALPAVRVELVDVDPAMLAEARTRLAPDAARVTVRQASFDDPLPACDAVVASLALHHVHALDAKRALYRRIHGALRPGGVLLVADATVHDAGAARDRIFTDWTRHLQRHGFTAAEAAAHFAAWAEEDRYHPLIDELGALRDAGFAAPDCFWKDGASTVFGGFR